MNSSSKKLTSLSLAAIALLAPASAFAEGIALRVEPVDAKTIRLDGVPKEWPAGMVDLSLSVKGKPSKDDLDARAVVAYDDASIFVAADVTDDKLVAGGDHVSLVLGFPGGASYEVGIFPGEPGKSPGSAKIGGRAVGGAKVVEAPRAEGYTLEATIPWSAFPEARTLRIGLRGALMVHDADGGGDQAIMGTATSTAYRSLPALSMDSEQALGDGFLREKGIRTAPAFNLIADVVGDAMKERVMVFDRYLVVLGPTYRNGSEYYFADLGAGASEGMLPSLELRDLTGDGHPDLIFKKRFGTSRRYRETIEVLSFGKGDVPETVFRHEIGLTTESGSVANRVSFVSEAGKTAIRVEPGTAKGFDASNYREATETAFDPLLLPWGTTKSETYRFSGGAFTKASEEKQAGVAPPPPRKPSPATADAPPAPNPSELLERVYDIYKKDRGVTGRPRFDFVADVAGSKQTERVLLHDRDLVVFGKGFKGGTGYVFLTLAQFSASSDIKDVVARDLTGDGKAEIVLRGVVHASAPKEAGAGTVDREVMMILDVSETGIRRVFAVETARAMGRKRVEAKLTFVPVSKGVEIEVSAGRASEWTKATYPFNQDTGPVSGFEPLILPWSGIGPVRYRWTSAGFVR